MAQSLFHPRSKGAHCASATGRLCPASACSPQSLLSCADSPADLHEAEALLRRAVAVAERLAGAQGDSAGGGNGSDDDGDIGLPLADANAACRRECEAGDEARRALAMLLCQLGRDDEAAGHLKQLGYTHRLARQVGRRVGPSSELAGSCTLAHD